MNAYQTLKQFSTKAALVVLATGFALLGVLSSTAGEEVQSTAVASSRGFSLIVTTVDLLIAVAFLCCAMLYWRRVPGVSRPSLEQPENFGNRQDSPTPSSRALVF